MHVPPTLPPAVTGLLPRDRALSLRAYAPAINKDERTASFVFATENPTILRYDWDIGEYFEVLSCTPEAADLSRLNSGGAFLSEHDRDKQIGVHLSATMDADRKGRATVKFSRSALGEQEFQDVQDGIRSNISVSYQPLSMVLQRTGSDTEPPTYLVDRWEALENSLVSVPADVNCRVGRAAAEAATEPPANAPRCKITVPDNLRSQHEQTMIRRNRTLQFHAAPNDGGSGTGAAVEPTPEQRTSLQKEGAENERKRCNAIREFVTFFSKGGVNCRDEAEKFIKDGRSPEEFRAHVMSDAFKPEPLNLQVVDESVPNGARNLGGNVPALSVGSQFVRSKGFEHLRKNGGRLERGQSVVLDVPDCTMLGARGKASLSARQRAGFTSTDLAPVNIQVLPGMIELGLQRLTIMDLLTGGTTTAAALPYAKENGYGTINGQPFGPGYGNTPGFPRAQAVGEGGLKPLWDADLTTDVANTKKIAVTTKVPDEFLADFAGMQSYIDGRLPYMVDLETEAELLYGSGQNNQLKGIFTNAGIQQRTIDASSDTAVAASLKKGLTDVDVYSQFVSTGYAFHPFDWETASLLKDSAGRFLAGGPFYIPYGNGVFVEQYTFWGKPVVISLSVKYGQPVCGSWKLGAQYFMREGMRLEMTNSNEDDFRRNLIAMRAEHRLALATYRPVAFLEFVGFPPRQ